MEYIDPVFAIGDFGDVRNDELTLDATIAEAGAGGGPSSPAPGALSLVPPRPGGGAVFGIPAWIFILGGIVFLIASSEQS